jgi:hypothetical protein
MSVTVKIAGPPVEDHTPPIPRKDTIRPKGFSRWAGLIVKELNISKKRILKTLRNFTAKKVQKKIVGKI